MKEKRILDSDIANIRLLCHLVLSYPLVFFAHVLFWVGEEVIKSNLLSFAGITRIPVS